VEEARKDALEVAQEADAPTQAGAEDATAVGSPRVLLNDENGTPALQGKGARSGRAVVDDSIVGQYARVLIKEGTGPLRKGLTLACRLIGVSMSMRSEEASTLRGQVVSNDTDGPLSADLIHGSLIITPEDPDFSEARILETGTFRARLGLLTVGGDLVATGDGAVVRISEEIPYERTCPQCSGWKMCEDCAGTGGESAPCPYCEGSGQCTRCHGSGSLIEPD